MESVAASNVLVVTADAPTDVVDRLITRLDAGASEQGVPIRIDTLDGVSLAQRRGSRDVIVLLITNSLVAQLLELSASESLPLSPGRAYWIVCEPIKLDGGPIEAAASPLVDEDQALSELSTERRDALIDEAAKKLLTHVRQVRDGRPEFPNLGARSTKTKKTSARQFSENASSESAVHQSSEEAAGTYELARLEEFTVSDGVRYIMTRSTDLAVGATPANSVTTSFVLFGMSESAGDTQPWVAHFLRAELDKAEQRYEEVRERYFASKAARGLRTRPASKAPRPTHMTSNVFAGMHRAAEIAKRTSHGDVTIHARHLLAALLTAGAEQPTGLERRLSELAVDTKNIRGHFYDWLRGHGDDDTAWAELLVGQPTPYRRLASFSADRAGGSEDLLNIDPDVQALAALIAARTVSPPLSIGLFGEWGSGKTFFMRSLRKAIDDLSAEARRLVNGKEPMQRDLPFYKHIAQIEFNAWHYVEGNLWASLVEHILENLYQKKDRSVTRGLQEKLIERLDKEKALTQATSAAVETAKKASASAEGDLITAQTALDAKTEELAALKAATVAKDFQLTGAFKPVSDALGQLGLTAVGKKAVELETALKQIHTVLGRGQRILSPIMRAKDRGRRLTWLALSLIGAPVVALLVNLILRAKGFNQADIIARASGIATGIGFVVTWLNRQAKWMTDRLNEAEAAQTAFDQEMAKETSSHVAAVTAAEQKVRELSSALEAAQQKHADAKSRVEAAQADLDAATTGRLLANFISDRAASTDYRKHLGVLALIRDDFEKLSGLIEDDNWQLSPEDPNEPPRDDLERFATIDDEQKDTERRINRIVLYIDDLDRCPPNKVVEVLQAVHLLLAFPLFVVVVGVDARWVTKSLETRYRELLRIDSKTGADDRDQLAGAATPNDYLEKIFQIPFWLRPMEDKDAVNMMKGLLKGTMVAAPQKTPAAKEGQTVAQGAGVAATAGTGAAAGATGTGTLAGASQPQQQQQPQPPEQPQPQPQQAKAKPPVQDLTLSDAELDYMAKLSPILGRSPRALKRFINVYRLIKAGLPEQPLNDFTRPRQPLADFEAVLFLLAVDTGAPLAARAVFDVLDGYGNGNGTAPRNKAQSIADLVRTLNDDGAVNTTADWKRLSRWLEGPQQVVPKDVDLAVVGAWADRVGRFSFEVGRA